MQKRRHIYPALPDIIINLIRKSSEQKQKIHHYRPRPHFPPKVHMFSKAQCSLCSYDLAIPVTYPTPHRRKGHPSQPFCLRYTNTHGETVPSHKPNPHDPTLHRQIATPEAQSHNPAQDINTPHYYATSDTSSSPILIDLNLVDGATGREDEETDSPLLPMRCTAWPLKLPAEAAGMELPLPPDRWTRSADGVPPADVLPAVERPSELLPPNLGPEVLRTDAPSEWDELEGPSRSSVS